MGTNYYAHKHVCPCCKKPEEVIHIGKKSSGWQFAFHAVGDLDCYTAWMRFLQEKPDVNIVNEYDEEIALDDFKLIVDRKRDGDKNHYDEMTKTHSPDNEYMRQIYKDAKGFCFDPGDFS